MDKNSRSHASPSFLQDIIQIKGEKTLNLTGTERVWSGLDRKPTRLLQSGFLLHQSEKRVQIMFSWLTRTRRGSWHVRESNEAKKPPSARKDFLFNLLV